MKLRRQIVLSNTVDVGREGAHVEGVASKRGARIDHDELREITEVVGDLDVVEGQSRNGESDTRVLTEEEGQGAAQETTTNKVAKTNKRGVASYVTNHVVVALTLVSGAAPLKVVVEPVRVKLVNLEIVKLDLNVTDQVVHQVRDVTHSGGILSGRRRQLDIGLEANSGHPHTQIGAQNVITLSRQTERRLASTKLSGGTDVTKRDRNKGEPIALLNRGNEPCDGVGATIHETLELSESCEVDGATVQSP